MSKKIKVKSLIDCALLKLANLIVETIGMKTEFDQDASLTIVEINCYLEESGSPNYIYQDLLRIILSSSYIDASVRFTCLQMLLNEQTHYLITEIFPFSYYEKILQVISAQGIGLRLLNLKGVWVKEEHMNLMIEIIRKLTQLTNLNIPYIANDDLLKEIGEYSSQLKVLNISGETDITEIGIEYICFGVCNNLSIINIGVLGEENICHTDIALLIMYLPNLVNLVTYSFVGKSLLYIYKEKNPNFKCKLEYIHDIKTNLETMEAIVNTCPNLESLYIDSPENNVVKEIKYLKLVQLKLYKFCCNELMEALNTIGNKLKHLTVIKGRKEFDIGKVSIMCPGLTDLDCYLMEDLHFTSYDRDFTVINILKIYNCSINLNSLKNLISTTSLNLKRLAIDFRFTDEDIASIFLENDFQHLEDVSLTSELLTIVTVEILMARCPEMKSLGQYSNWSITQDDLLLLKGILKSGNSCLFLFP